jgi:hypothetical protein
MRHPFSFVWEGYLLVDVMDGVFGCKALMWFVMVFMLMEACFSVGGGTRGCVWECGIRSQVDS